MKKEHTKGKWEPIIFDISDYKQCCVGSIDTGIVVAHILVFGDTISEEDRANTKLIAAAPEMLEALIMLTSGIETNIVHGFENPCNCQICRAKQTIKKATE